MAQPATAPNFGSILDRPSESIERPKPLPVGTYLWVVKGQPRQDKSSRKGTEFVEYTVEPLQAAEDVDQEALHEALTNKQTGEVKPLQAKQRKVTFYITEDAIWRLKDFLDHCGVEDGKNISLRQRISGANGCQFLGAIRHEASEDGSTIYDRIGQTTAVPA